MLATERRAALLDALQRLSDADREVISYRYLLELSEAETAAALGVPVGTAKSRLSRALDRLRAVMPTGRCRHERPLRADGRRRAGGAAGRPRRSSPSRRRPTWRPPSGRGCGPRLDRVAPTGPRPLAAPQPRRGPCCSRPRSPCCRRRRVRRALRAGAPVDRARPPADRRARAARSATRGAPRRPAPPARSRSRWPRARGHPRRGRLRGPRPGRPRAARRGLPRRRRAARPGRPRVRATGRPAGVAPAGWSGPARDPEPGRGRRGPGPQARRPRLATVEPVDVDGAPGVWISGRAAPLLVPGARRLVHRGSRRLVGDTLAWERDGILYRIEGAITLEQALDIARSMR